MAVGIMVIASTFVIKNSYNKLVYVTAVLITLMVLIGGEYLLAPMQNIIFYILTILLAFSLFLVAHFYLIPEDSRTKRDEILMGIGLISFLLVLSLMYGLIHNDFTRTLILGVFLLIIIFIILVIRIKGFNNILKTFEVFWGKLSKFRIKFHINYGAILLGSTVLIISEFMFSILFGPYSTFISALLMACVVKYMTEGFKEFLVNFLITIFIVYLSFLIFLQ